LIIIDDLIYLFSYLIRVSTMSAVVPSVKSIDQWDVSATKHHTLSSTFNSSLPQQQPY